MTTNELAIALLDHIERMESERAALAAWIRFCRDRFGNQPDWRTLADDPAVRGTVRVKYVQLRQSILLATDDKSVLVLLQSLIED
jgi:hypothetical protein